LIKQKQIRERIIKFEKFLKENDAKRQRANAKAIAEKKLREQKVVCDLQRKAKQLL
jgi:SOS response regulatory protein OraA/RecX